MVMISMILALGWVVLLPLSLKKYIEYLYGKDDLTDLERSNQMIYFTIVMVLITMSVLATIDVLRGMKL